MEAGLYALTRGMCLVARRLEVVAVAGLLWISWCVLGSAGFFFFFRFFLFERSEFLIDTSQKKRLRVCPRAVCTCARVQ